jgi:hypothetical protein
MQPALSGNRFSLHRREVYSGPASLLPLGSSMLIKCTQLSIEVTLAGIFSTDLWWSSLKSHQCRWLGI